MKALSGLGLLLLVGCSAPEPQTASADEAAALCVLPSVIAAPEARRPPAEDVVRTTPAYHLLALTWSPEWCRTRSGRSSEKLQCVDNSFGWVLHGLWPNAQSGPQPRFCRPASRLTVAQVRANLCKTPSADLIQHEWAAHGTCGFETADAYLDAAAELYDRVKQPDTARLAALPQPITAGDIRDAFIAANPDIPRQAMFVGRNDDGRLDEVRICYSLDLDHAQPCPANRRGARDTTKVTVTPKRF